MVGDARLAVERFGAGEAGPLFHVIIVHHDKGDAIAQRAAMQVDLLRIVAVLLPPAPHPLGDSATLAFAPLATIGTAHGRAIDGEAVDG